LPGLVLLPFMPGTPMRHPFAAVALLLATGTVSLAQGEGEWQPLPEHLTIGYEGEGKVDASPEACRAFVKEMLEWPDDKMQIEVDEVCGARKRHLVAYDALQSSYTELRKYLDKDHRLFSAAAVKDFEAMVKACISHKTNINTGGHNIRMDIIPNDVAAACLKIGKDLLDAETDWFKVGFTVSHPAP
jgi:hypothetical protein